MKHQLEKAKDKLLRDRRYVHVLRQTPCVVMGSFRMRASLMIGLTCLVGPAFAVCAGNQETVFSCAVQSKTVELCLTPADQSVTYRFGPASAPEIELTRSFDDISMRPWNGVSRSIWHSVTVPSDGFSYELHWAFDKIESEASAGLTVLRGDQELATLVCSNMDASETVVDLDTLNFAMEDARYCRSDPAKQLRLGPCE